jgi:hypothetical protein
MSTIDALKRAWMAGWAARKAVDLVLMYNGEVSTSKEKLFEGWYQAEVAKLAEPLQEVLTPVETTISMSLNIVAKQLEIDRLIDECKSRGIPYPKTSGNLVTTHEMADKIINQMKSALQAIKPDLSQNYEGYDHDFKSTSRVEFGWPSDNE